MLGLQIALIRLGLFIISLLPARLTGAFGAGLGRVGYYLDRRHRKVCHQNLARIYPHLSRKQRHHMARESMAELGRTLFELPHVFMRPKEFLLSRIKLDGVEKLRDAVKKGRGVILTACHHSNWELGALSFSMLGFETDIIYRPLRQKSLDRVLKQCRERFGTHMRSRKDGLRWLPRALKQGHCIAVMIDQHMLNGLPVPFLGHLAKTTTLPAVFARKYHTPVLGVALNRIGRDFRFRLQFWEIDLQPHLADERMAMAEICDSFTPIIDARPELWLWSHRRWRLLDQVPGMAEVVHGAP